MKKSRFNEAQIIGALKEAVAGVKLGRAGSAADTGRWSQLPTRPREAGRSRQRARTAPRALAPTGGRASRPLRMLRRAGLPRARAGHAGAVQHVHQPRLSGLEPDRVDGGRPALTRPSS